MARRENEIEALVRSKKSGVAWVIKHAGRWYAIVFIPGQRSLGVIPYTSKDLLVRLLEETREETGLPLRIVQGIDGLAATDPHWDGNETFVCSNPRCRAVHSAHENVAKNLIQQCTRLTPISLEGK
jgi:hypothetical protein